MDIKEQKAKRYVESIPQFDERKKYCYEDFIAGWEAALKNQWVKVEDRLPKKDERVFVLFIYRGNIIHGIFLHVLLIYHQPR